MVPRTIIIETKKVVMVPAPVTSNIIVVQNSSVNAVGKIVTSRIKRNFQNIDTFFQYVRKLMFRLILSPNFFF